MFRATLIISSLLILSHSLWAEVPAPQSNKLKEMLRLYYLPFSIEFKEGATLNELFPIKPDRQGVFNRMIPSEDMQTLDGEWRVLKEEWKKKSLLLSTIISLGESNRISSHLVTHHIPASRTALESLSLDERIQLQSLLSDKPQKVQAIVLQSIFLKSFMAGTDHERFNFFVFSPHWCESSREYRAIFETYFKQFPEKDVVFHSVVIEDPKEDIFDSKVFRDLFPHPEKYSHESVPRFLALETVNGQTRVYEEGEALREVYERYLVKHRGFLDLKSTLLKNVVTTPSKTGVSIANK